MVLLEVGKGSVGHPGDPGSLPASLEGVGKAFQRSGRGQEALTEVQKARPEAQEGSAGPSGGFGGVGMPSRKSRKGQKALPEVWKRDGSPLWRSGMGRDALQAGWEGLRGPPVVRYGSRGPSRDPEGVGMPSRRSERGWEYLMEVCEGSGIPPGGP